MDETLYVKLILVRKHCYCRFIKRYRLALTDQTPGIGDREMTDLKSLFQVRTAVDRCESCKHVLRRPCPGRYAMNLHGRRTNVLIATPLNAHALWKPARFFLSSPQERLGYFLCFISQVHPLLAIDIEVIDPRLGRKADHPRNIRPTTRSRSNGSPSGLSLF